MIKTNLFLYLLFLASSVLEPCHAQSKIGGYDLTHPDKIIELPGEVNEISGITYNDGHVFAIDDEHGDLFKIELKDKPKIEKWSFGKSKDYEDVVLFNNTFFVLNSNGQIVEFDKKFPIDKTNKEEIKNKGQNEYESLYYDPAVQKLVVLCKDCSNDKKDENTAFSYDLSSQSFDKKPLYIIEQKQIEKVLGKKIEKFKPSAATVNPLTQEVYVISSINKLLLIMKNNTMIKATPLDPKLFNQPEGITFSPNGDLFISNEAGTKGKATILMFKQKQN
jgi:uncharacterized protein YjiK